jgi:hypothetical protein
MSSHQARPHQRAIRVTWKPHANKALIERLNHCLSHCSDMRKLPIRTKCCKCVKGFARDQEKRMYVAQGRIGIRCVDHRPKRGATIINTITECTVPMGSWLKPIRRVSLPQRKHECALVHPFEIRLLRSDGVMHAAEVRGARVELFGH